MDRFYRLKEKNMENRKYDDLEKKIYFLDHINKINPNEINKLIILIKLLKKQYSELTIAIKTPNASHDRYWGDYFFALSLKKSLEKKGFKVIIHEFDYWDIDDSDIVIHLRGLRKYSPKPQHLNIMWNISHPNNISINEYNEFDLIFVASKKYVKMIENKTDVIVHPLLQCTDLDKFYPQKNNEFDEEILFVGNSRNHFRKIIQDILKTPHDFSIYGKNWNTIVDEKYIKGDFIDNNNLNKAYSNCKILLNDHWEDMVENDFISNRIFDALACKTFVISDNVNSIRTLFEGCVVTYEDYNDLNEKLTYYLTHENERMQLTQKGHEIVAKNHTFDNRVSELISVIEKKYFPKFLNQFETNRINTNAKQDKITNDFIKKFLNINYSQLLCQNRNMNIEIAKLQEKIFFLEQEKKIYKKNYSNSKKKSLLKILKKNF